MSELVSNNNETEIVSSSNIENNSKIRIASCTCGQLSIKCYNDPIRVSICHCTECQKRTGSIFGVQARFNKNDIIITGNSTEYKRIADSGNEILFHFCNICGSTLYWFPLSLPDVIVIAAGNFNYNKDNFPLPIVSVYNDRAVSWCKFTNEMEIWN